MTHHIGTDVKALRSQRQLTLNDIAARTGLSVSYLSDIERRRTDPTVETLGKIAAALGITLGALFGLADAALTTEEHRLLDAYRNRDFRLLLRIIGDAIAEDGLVEVKR